MSEQVHQQVFELLARIDRATKANLVKWKLVNDAVTLQLAHGAVTIISRDGDGVAPFLVRVLGADGTTVEAFETEDGYVTSQNSSSTVRLTDIFETARRDALGVRQVLDNLLNDLPPEGALPDDDIPF